MPIGSRPQALSSGTILDLLQLGLPADSAPAPDVGGHAMEGRRKLPGKHSRLHGVRHGGWQVEQPMIHYAWDHVTEELAFASQHGCHDECSACRDVVNLNELKTSLTCL